MKYKHTTSQELLDRSLPRFVLCSLFLSKGELLTTLKESYIDPVITWLDIDQQWNKTEGESIRIAVLDSGVGVHDNLEGAVVEAVDFTASKEGAKDVQGHGTHVIGIIAARKKAQGMIGVAPKALIYSAKVLDDEGESSIDALVQGIAWAIEKGVHIISISWICNQTSQALEAIIQQAAAAGIFIISAVGNSGEQMKKAVYPASYKEVIAVGAVQIDGTIAHYSSRGKQVDFVAPGKLLSTYLNNTFVTWEGTSMAVAYATGVVALLLALHFKEYGYSPIKTYQELRAHLTASTIDLGLLGRDDIYGHGLIDPQQVLKIDSFRRHIARSKRSI